MAQRKAFLFYLALFCVVLYTRALEIHCRSFLLLETAPHLEDTSHSHAVPPGSRGSSCNGTYTLNPATCRKHFDLELPRKKYIEAMSNPKYLDCILCPASSSWLASPSAIQFTCTQRQRCYSTWHFEMTDLGVSWIWISYVSLSLGRKWVIGCILRQICMW